MIDYVTRGGQAITAGQLDSFKRKLPFLKVKAETIETPDFPHIRKQIHFLTRYAEDVLDMVYPCSDLAAIGETVFALGYLLKDVDIIPDSLPGIGFADDSAILRAVLQTHENEFRDFAEKSGLDFDLVTVEA